MIKKTLAITILLLSIICVATQAQYTEDIIGDEYKRITVSQPADYDGDVVSTIVKKESQTKSNTALIYVHGYNDYFFQKELGDSICFHGYNFYAIDLRKYGRSILPNQDQFFCKKLDEYFADIDSTISIVQKEGNEKIVLMGHSTGGLILSLYMGQKGETNHIKGLILNSPFLDWNLSKTVEGVVMPCVSGLGAIFKRVKVQGESSNPSGYAQSLLKKHKGEWDYNTNWKKSGGHPKRSGWVRAIHRGHKKIHKGLNIECPILVMSSDKTTTETDEWCEDFRHTDVVLDVDEIHKYGDKLGKNVTHAVIKGGIHDLILSPQPARDEAYITIFQWLDSILSSSM